MTDEPIELIRVEGEDRDWSDVVLPPRRFLVLRWPTGVVDVLGEVDHPAASPVPPKEEA